MTNEEQYRVALNVAARVGLSGDVIGEFAKAMSASHGFSSQMQMAEAQNTPSPTPPDAISPPISSQMGDSVTQGDIPSNTPPIA